MNMTPRWRLAHAIPPPIASTIGGLLARHSGADAIVTLGLAILAGSLSLAAMAIREHATTRRAGLPYEAEIELARAEARNRGLYARAQTRRSKPLTGGERYRPDAATSLAEIMRSMHESTAADHAAGATNPSHATRSAITTAPRAKRTARQPRAIA